MTSIRVVCDRPGDGRGGHRDFDTRAGTIDVAIPKLRNGSHFPTGYGSLAAAPNEH
ncbi:transposase [Actinomadura madurae]|uniref:transposase n=1 Tax=Actinomadura madurae TaxID=1993 RepID=UPI0039994F5A